MPRGDKSRAQRGQAGKGSPPFVEDSPRDEDEAETDNPGPDHNGRLKSLAAALEKHCDLQDQEDKLLERYIEPIRRKKAEVKADAKKDFDIPTEAFNARAGLRRIERSSDNDEVVLATRELFEALPVGQNLDFVAIAERVAKTKAEKAAKKSKATADEVAVH